MKQGRKYIVEYKDETEVKHETLASVLLIFEEEKSLIKRVYVKEFKNRRKEEEWILTLYSESENINVL